MKAITKYVANDGAEFTDKAKCEKHDALIVEVDALMATLPKLPHDRDCAFSNGTGYIQHYPAGFLAYREAVLRLAQRYQEHDWLQQSIDKPLECHASWAGRIIDECCPEPIRKAWYRVQCVSTKTFREYGQPYYTTHEDEVKVARG